jgi:uncharacterized protein (UPF0332 family)
VTGENRRQNALDELSRADVCLREARVLIDSGLPYGAASRGYYAVFHTARSLLFSVGLEASSHKGTVVLLGQHFVSPGLLSARMARLVSRMQRDREDADYSTGAVFTRDEAAGMLADAEAFVAEARCLVTTTEGPPD